MVVRGTIMLFVFLLLSILFAAAHADNRRFVDDELYQRALVEMDAEIDEARQLIGLEADGELASKCGPLSPCNTGYECYHYRCIPSRDCLNEKMKEFDQTFDEVCA